MNFYTSVARYGNSILYRGYNHQGQRIVRKDKFKPTLFIPCKVDEGWTAIDGQVVAPITFVGLTALSVDTMTNFSTPNSEANSAKIRVPITLVLIAS